MPKALEDLFNPENAPSTSNDFGGDSDWDYVAPTAAERGDDFVGDDDDDSSSEEDDHSEDDPAADADTDPADDDGADGEADGESDTEVDAEPEEDEPEDEPEEEEDEKPKKKVKGHVPRSRLNKEIEKRRALEDRIRDLEATGNEPKAERKPSEPSKVKEKLSKEGFTRMQEAMIEGNTDEAFEVFAEMMATVAADVRDEASALARSEAEQEFSLKQTQSALAATAAELAQSYPELDHQGAEADEDLIAEVVELRNSYINRGQDPATALRKAVRLVALDNELVDRKAAPKKDTKGPLADAVARKQALAAKERGKLGGTGSTTPARTNKVANLSESDFARTSEEARRRARGDYLD